jgi:outer membrane protein TolC
MIKAATRIILIVAFACIRVCAAETNGASQQIDLAAVLRLAGAQNRDVQIARERVAEAHANLDAATWQFFPWIAPGVAYRAHDNAIQDVAGQVVNVHKDAFTVGPTIIAQLDLGDAIYKRLAAIQLAKAAEHASAAEQAEATFVAASAYFELSRAQASIETIQESVRLAEDYARQLESAVDAGVSFKGDALRARTQAERNKIALRQAQEQRATASARLAQVLHLNSPVELSPRMEEFVPITLTETNVALEALVQRALVARPELRQSEATVKAADEVRTGAKYGPLMPTLGAQAFVGGLGGGNETSYRGLSESEDYQVTATWRLGPGGLFDRTRVRGAEARLNAARYASEKLRDEVVRQVVEAFNKTQSETDKLAMTKRAVAAAEQSYRLARERKESAVGNAFETIFAEQEFTQLRQDYVSSIADFNKAQYQLLRATGQTGAPKP